MVTKIIYNCDPDSIGDISQSDFVDAFQNEVVQRPAFLEADIEVTFNAGKSCIVSISQCEPHVQDDPIYFYVEKIEDAAGKAFSICCA